MIENKTKRIRHIVGGVVIHGSTDVYSVSDRLRAENARLREALQALADICDNVPMFQLDHGKSSVRAVRLAGKFVAAHRAARDALAHTGQE